MRTRIHPGGRVSNWKIFANPRRAFSMRSLHMHVFRAGYRHLYGAGRLSGVSSPRFSPRDDTNWMIQYRGNVIGNEIGRPLRFVTCNFSARAPRADNEGKKIAAAVDKWQCIFASSPNNVQLYTYICIYRYTSESSPFLP